MLNSNLKLFYNLLLNLLKIHNLLFKLTLALHYSSYLNVSNQIFMEIKIILD